MEQLWWTEELRRWRGIAQKAADYLINNGTRSVSGIASLDPISSNRAERKESVEYFLVDFVYDVFGFSQQPFFSFDYRYDTKNDGDGLMQYWVSEVLSLGFDLDSYGRKANALCTGTLMQRDVYDDEMMDWMRIPSRLESLTYGGEPEAWRWNWSTPFNERASEYCDRRREMNRQAREYHCKSIPGSWTEERPFTREQWIWDDEERDDTLENRMNGQSWRRQEWLGQQWRSTHPHWGFILMESD